MLLHFRTAETDIDVDVTADGDDWRLVIEGRAAPLQIRRDRTGAWLVETHQGRRRLWVAARGDERFVFCDGRVHRLRLLDPEHEDDEEDTAAGLNLAAAMPGKVVQVLVEVGQEVAAGQPVIIMESMKMETELTAGTDAVVQAVHVTAGQVVAQGEALVDLTAGE